MLQPNIGVTDQRMPFETYFGSLSEKPTAAFFLFSFCFWNWGNIIQPAPEAIQVRCAILSQENHNRLNLLAWLHGVGTIIS